MGEAEGFWEVLGGSLGGVEGLREGLGEFGGGGLRDFGKVWGNLGGLRRMQGVLGGI